MTTDTKERPTVVQVAPAPRVRVALAAQVLGLTEKAIRMKIHEGRWVQGRQYHRDPEGGIWIDINGVMSWVEKAPA